MINRLLIVPHLDLLLRGVQRGGFLLQSRFFAVPASQETAAGGRGVRGRPGVLSPDGHGGVCVGGGAPDGGGKGLGRPWWSPPRDGVGARPGSGQEEGTHAPPRHTLLPTP